MSLVGMLRQYATGGPGASQETTERKGPVPFRGGDLAQSPNVRNFDSQSFGGKVKKGNEELVEEHKGRTGSLQIVSDLDEEFDSEFGNEIGLKELSLPDLPREPTVNNNNN